MAVADGRPAEPAGARSGAQTLYPPSPAAPPGLHRPSAAYRLRVVLVLGSLFSFLLVYLALVAGSAWLVYWTAWVVPTPEGRTAIFKFGAVAGAAMLFLFLLKGLFKRSRRDTEEYREVTARHQPDLFEFLRRLCAEAGSPFPRAVYLSPEVNAAVFYPRSLFTLVWPARKNLLIGLGLVNVLHLSELKAVLAHEFGHFSQSSMKLGQYVYVANQVIADMVFGRDRWDVWLERWRSIDLRLSLPAWVLSGVVWVLRKLLALVFRGINLLNFSLMRQMEFNADLHAVRLTGSDALISGLWKTERAGLATRMAFSELASMAEHGKLSRDVLFHQTDALERLGKALEKAEGPQAADLRRPYRWGPEVHFQGGDEPGAAMWQTHPSNRERERNAKRVYVPHPPREEPAWSLLRSVDELRRDASERVYRQILGEEASRGKDLLPPEEVRRLILDEREEMKQGEHYHGFYDSRIVLPGRIDELAGEIDRAAAEGTLDAAALRAEAAAWAGEPLRRTMEGMREREARGEKRGDREQVEKERDELFRELNRGDRALFRHFYHRSGEAAGGSPSRREELLARYRFLLRVQEEIRALLPVEGELAGAVGLLQSGRRLSSEEAQAILNVFSSAWSTLEPALRRCESTRLPRLSHLEEQQSVRSFLLPEDLVPSPPSDHLDGAWIGKFLGQFQQVLGRLRKLHFKNLGLLLRLQEELDPELHRPAAAAAA